MGEACDQNLWAIKSIWRCYELLSGLKINYHKSSLIGVNVSRPFLTSEAEFLNYKLAALLFWYLGLPVGANLRKLSTWQPVIDALSKRLMSWKNKYLSIGGRWCY